MPALASLMNPVEPDPRYTSDHQQNGRAQTYPPPQPQGSLSYNHSINNANNFSQTYGPSFSSLGPNRDQSGAPTFQNARPPAFSDPPRSLSIQLAPLSALTATLPPPNSTQGAYSSYPTAYQTSRPDTKPFGSDLQFQSSEGYSSSSARGPVVRGHGSSGYGNHYSAMVPPLHNPVASSSGWKDPILISSSSSTTSSTKSSSTSPQPRHWGRKLSPRRSSENVNGRSYATAMDYMFPNDAVRILHRQSLRVADVFLIQLL